MKFVLSEIEWEVDDETLEIECLPTEVELSVDSSDYDYCDEREFADMLMDKICDNYGWCINTCYYEFI